jgi:hypothetical protein
MSAIKQTCERVVANAHFSGIRFDYQCPTGAVDRKREGRYLRIGHGSDSITLDGSALRTMKRLLRDVGEVGCIRRAKTMVLGPK